MNYSKSISTLILAVAVCLAAPGVADAQRGGGSHGGGGGGGRAPSGGGGRPPSGGGAVVGHAAPRTYGGAPGHYPGGGYYGGGRYYGGRYYYPAHVVGYAPYYPYYYPYRYGISFGFYAGWYPYGYPYYGYAYPYPYYYGAYSYPPAYSGYTAAPPANYVSAQPGAAYGGVRLMGAPEDAQVLVDGYYIGVVGDFNGSNQHMNLEAGRHTLEIRPHGQQPITLDVNVLAGQTITIRADIQQQ